VGSTSMIYPPDTMTRKSASRRFIKPPGARPRAGPPFITTSRRVRRHHRSRALERAREVPGRDKKVLSRSSGLGHLLPR